ncbi:MAG TPA: PCYCGC motif-containing (lipo)protein [Candidatus Binatia bacterium]|nr:PCYCGC motif-containing (lipo)protein [Candidatus Binatia bacterium]
MRLLLSRRTTAPALLAFTVLLGGTTAACSGTDPDAPAVAGGGAAAVEAVVPSGNVVIPTSAEIAAAWDRRPDYVRALPEDWQAAYKFALARPDVIGWMPCNCGCGADGHRSNLDCFFDRRESGEITFQEHGSYCDICVETSNLAAKLLDEGKSMAEIRAAVDATFGGGGHSTDTPLPPT